MSTVSLLATGGANPLVPNVGENLVTVLGATVLVLMVAAVLSLARTPGQDPVLRLLWLMVVLAFPVAGAALWFALGRRALRSPTPHPA